ncbi:MAG: M4 family metallopeptidase, partial [candidate division KSB1 bacterium]|nr:M4 family metallopeptidase [candidate division KSB1 bacterium]
SDKIALLSMGAREVSPAQAPRLHAIIDRLCVQANLPKPRVAVAVTPMPNAFAVGRSPKAATVCATTGLLDLLSDAELEGVLGHELTHGVTQYEANLAYWDQSGALNESFSDVFGALVKQRQRHQTAAEADWLIGQGLLTANVNGVALRSMKAPGTAYHDPVLGEDPQPAHMSAYRNVDYDNGGVHINSGIPNHAFYVVARELGGHAWEKAGRIWYVTLRDKLATRSDFQEAANLTYQVAGELFGRGSLEQQAVRTGWAEVGLTIAEPGGGGGNKGCLLVPVSVLTAALRR